jgi:hypothetical protein
MGETITLTDADRQHREQFAEYSSHHAHGPFRRELARLVARAAEYNAAHFGDKLLPPHILLAEPKNLSAIGDHANISGWGSRGQIRIRPSIVTGEHGKVRAGDEFAAGRMLLALDICCTR